MNELWALLWSKKSNGFHIEPLERTVKAGTRFFDENMTNDYLLIYVGTQEAVDQKADELRPLLLERDAVKRLYGSDPE